MNRQAPRQLSDTLETLLGKPDCTLAQVLQEDQLLEALKFQNEKLIAL